MIRCERLPATPCNPSSFNFTPRQIHSNSGAARKVKCMCRGPGECGEEKKGERDDNAWDVDVDAMPQPSSWVVGSKRVFIIRHLMLEKYADNIWANKCTILDDWIKNTEKHQREREARERPRGKKKGRKICSARIGKARAEAQANRTRT